MAGLDKKRDLTDDEFTKLEIDINDELKDQDLETLKYLCLDGSVGLKLGEIDSIKNSLDLFSKLETRMLLSKTNLDLLIELMDLIRRADLKKEIEEKCGKLEETKMISPYRRMVLDLTHEINATELENLKTAALRKKLKGCKLTDLKYPIQMMYALERQGIIGPDNVEYLLTMCGFLRRPLLVNAVRKFQHDEMIGRYNMGSKQRGLCIIINNVKYLTPESNDETTLEERKGSEIDKEKLTQLFGTKFGLTVWKEKRTDDLTAQEIKDVMKAVSEVDHSGFDCFVCCILSHGNSGIVTGVDNKCCNIMDIARMLNSSNCPSLAFKPKMFIIQACQGTIYDEKVNINSMTTFDRDPREQNQFIPDDADFLFAYASSPGRMSKLNMNSGSVYIDKLTGVLDTHHKELDILSMLTLVNKEVCKQDLSGPKPGTVYGQFTLRKKLYFS